MIKQLEGPERIYNCTVKCISKTADVFRMKYDEFLRKFKPNKESWKIILATAKQKERQMNQRYVHIINQLESLLQSGEEITNQQITQL